MSNGNLSDGDLLILKWHEVAALLAGRELEIIEVVRAAYEAHASGASTLPHSLFSRWIAAESRKAFLATRKFFLSHLLGPLNRRRIQQ